jgi:hypothetical protein
MRESYTTPAGANGYLFAWTCSYLNRSWWSVVTPAGEKTTLELRSRLCDYEASIYNGGRDAYLREQGPLVGVLRFEHPCDRPMPPEIAAAFNAWRTRDHEGALAFMRLYPDRYGAESTWTAEMYAPPPLARDGGHYDAAAGCWRFNSQAKTEA